MNFQNDTNYNHIKPVPISQGENMNFDKLFEAVSLKKTNLYYRLKIIFGLFFLFPIFGFLYFVIKYGLLNDEYILLYFLGVLAFSFFGLVMLRRLFDEIKSISEVISHNVVTDLSGDRVEKSTDELHGLVNTFNTLDNKFQHTIKMLAKKASEISIL